MAEINEKKCPFCGNDNGCMAHEPMSCWCNTTNIPQKIREYIPEDKRMKACICKSCIELFIQDEALFKRKYLQ